jgi:hypothetical protein
MGIERDSWHPGEENGSLRILLFERSLPPLDGFFQLLLLTSAIMATTRAAKKEALIYSLSAFHSCIFTQYKEWDDANSELFKESHDAVLRKNTYEIRLYE